MAGSLELSSLYVEGVSDLHAILHLLCRHGIALDKDTGPVTLKTARSDRGVLDSMRTAAKASTHLPVGFVVDADVSVINRWHAVRDRLSEMRLALPPSPPRDGFIGESSETKSRIGVWIMPDNQKDEARLEDLIQTLVPDTDPLFDLARSSTAKASDAGARFKPQDRKKAELHCWLSWQEEPGLSFGTAIKVHYFRHDSEVALRFVEWFKKLFF